jgi:hypothetical protein
MWAAAWWPGRLRKGGTAVGGPGPPTWPACAPTRWTFEKVLTGSNYGGARPMFPRLLGLSAAAELDELITRRYRGSAPQATMVQGAMHAA